MVEALAKIAVKDAWAAAARAYAQAMALAAADPALAERTRLWRNAEIRPTIYRNAARACLHTADLRTAGEHLLRAIDAGLAREQVTALLEEDGLAHLHGTAAWREMLATLPPTGGGAGQEET